MSYPASLQVLNPPPISPKSSISILHRRTPHLPHPTLNLLFRPLPANLNPNLTLTTYLLPTAKLLKLDVLGMSNCACALYLLWRLALPTKAKSKIKEQDCSVLHLSFHLTLPLLQACAMLEPRDGHECGQPYQSQWRLRRRLMKGMYGPG
jgi:hypothetical protein